MKYFFLYSIGLSCCLSGFSQHKISVSSDKWKFNAGTHRVANYKGRESLFLEKGIAWLPESQFLNGTIDFEIAIPKERGYVGVIWRMQDTANFEEFYIRPHQSGNPDANQYTPVFNSSSGWQLYYGDGYAAPVVYDYDNWTRVRILVLNNRAEVYMNDLEKPVVIIPELKREAKTGMIGIICGEYSGAHFSGFSYTTDNPVLTTEPLKVQAPVRAGMITQWEISEVFAEEKIKPLTEISKEILKSFHWQSLEAERTGIVNLAKVSDIKKGNTVFARFTIQATKDMVTGLSFGFSDRARVFVNGLLQFYGNDSYRSRDYRFLGTMGLFDEVTLRLRKGINEIVIAVSEDTGGWGVIAQLDKREGLNISNESPIK